MKKTLLLCIITICLSIVSFAQTTFGPIQIIDVDLGEEGQEIASGDLDGDGDIDLAIATYDFNGGTPNQDYIKWYSNDGNGNFTIEGIVSSTIEWVDGLTITDIDGLHGADIVATSAFQNKLVYFLSDGMGGFGNEIQVNAAAINGPGEVIAGDINMDGTMDLATVVYSDNKTIWYSNDGNGNFTPEVDIENGSTDGPYYLDLADYDGDTDLDVVVGFFNSSNIEIYYNQFIENNDGTVSWVKDIVTVDSVGSTYLFNVDFGDVNNDGQLDIIKVDFSGGEVIWFNKAKNGASTSSVICGPAIITNPAKAFIVDLDGDNLNDVIVTEGGVADDALIWFKGNSNSNPETAETFIADNNHIIYDLVAVDLDNDTDNDIAIIGNTSDRVAWFENELVTLSLSDHLDLDSINVYPNPTKAILNFDGINEAPIQIAVYDVLGKQVLQKTLNTNETLNVSELTNGIYTIKFNNGFTTKFVKE